MSKNKREHSTLRLTAICLTTIMLPFGMFVGFEFGVKHTKTTALVALVIVTVLILAQSHVWWLTLEQAKAK